MPDALSSYIKLIDESIKILSASDASTVYSAEYGWMIALFLRDTARAVFLAGMTAKIK